MTKTTSKYEENKHKGKVVELSCPECKRKTRHQIVTSYDHDGSEYDEREGWGVDWSSSHQVIQCQGCMNTSFRETNYFSEDVQQIGPSEWETGERETLYPKRSERTLVIKDYYEVPSNLRKIYRETIDCINNNSFVLAAAGLRAIVEGICAELNITGGPTEVPKKGGGTQVKRTKDLAGKISGLSEKGYLAQKNADILHEHRYIGNNAVHQLSQPSIDELFLAMEIIENTFDSVFQIPEKGHELRIKRTKRNTKT